MDVAATFETCGFHHVAIMPFAETPQALERAGEAWRFPWAVIVGQK